MLALLADIIHSALSILCEILTENRSWKSEYKGYLKLMYGFSIVGRDEKNESLTRVFLWLIVKSVECRASHIDNASKPIPPTTKSTVNTVIALTQIIIEYLLPPPVVAAACNRVSACKQQVNR